MPHAVEVLNQDPQSHGGSRAASGRGGQSQRGGEGGPNFVSHAASGGRSNFLRQQSWGSGGADGIRGRRASGGSGYPNARSRASHAQLLHHRRTAHREPSAVDSTKVFVGNLPPEAIEEDLFEMFVPFGDVVEVVMLRKPSLTGSRCAFVRYTETTAAAAAMQALNGLGKGKGCAIPLVVRIADPPKIVPQQMMPPQSSSLTMDCTTPVTPLTSSPPAGPSTEPPSPLVRSSSSTHNPYSWDCFAESVSAPLVGGAWKYQEDLQQVIELDPMACEDCLGDVDVDTEEVPYVSEEYEPVDNRTPLGAQQMGLCYSDMNTDYNMGCKMYPTTSVPTCPCCCAQVSPTVASQQSLPHGSSVPSPGYYTNSLASSCGSTPIGYTPQLLQQTPSFSSTPPQHLTQPPPPPQRYYNAPPPNAYMHQVVPSYTHDPYAVTDSM